MSGYALPSTNPRGSGSIQWARGDVGLKPSAAARPQIHHYTPYHTYA